MQTMMRWALPTAIGWGQELDALHTFARSTWKDKKNKGRHLITKRPNDARRFDKIREFYGNPFFIMMIRDPRDALTSVHDSYKKRGFAVNGGEWMNVARPCMEQLDAGAPDVIMVRYEDFVNDPCAEQKRIQGAANIEFDLPFDTFYKANLPITTNLLNAMHGLRPVSSDAVGRWKRPEFADRLMKQWAVYPELNVVLERFYGVRYEP
tara:strand:- start:2198 stop:2821 length:624 start_codon:yes stop_codon:yes gene_type:complete